jgi:1-phosphofructokinase family hexose kinase
VIVTVTPNPALDLTYSLPQMSLGDSHRVSSPTLRAGGKGVNVARVLHNQGIPVFSLSTAGGVTGREFEAELVASEVPHRLTQVQAETRRTMAFVETQPRRTSIFNEFGTNHSPAEWDGLTDSVAAVLPDATCLVASGSLPTGADPDFFAHLVTLAQSRGIPSIVDATGPALLAAARAGVTLVKPNKYELNESTGEQDTVRAASILLKLGARHVLVSLGEQGMILFTHAEPGAPWQAVLPRVLIGNATGAGDAAVAAVAATYAKAFSDGFTPDNVDPRTILTLAASWSAAAVLTPVAGEISCNHAELALELHVSQPSVNGQKHGQLSEETMRGHRKERDTR